VLWGGLGFVGYLWMAGGGVKNMGDPMMAATSAGRLAGLISSDLLLVQVVMMARIPLLEKVFGQDRLISRHRLIGFTSFNLLLAHIVLITVGYAANNVRMLVSTFVGLVTDEPAMVLATAGTGFLILAVVSSVRVARRRLRYESWHLLHLYTYLGVGLVLPHQLWAGQDFLDSPAATIYWWSAWAGSIVAILIWRVGLPLTRSLRHQLRVSAVVPEGDGVVSVYLSGRRLRRLPARAGQFFGWRFMDRKGWTRGNPYSLSAAPDGRGLRITAKALGDNSTRLEELRPGTKVLMEGPYGRLTDRVRTKRRVALIGAGVGVTPLRALAEELEYEPGEVIMLQRFTDEPLFEPEFRRLAHDRGLQVVYLGGRRRSDDSWLGDRIGPHDDLDVLQHWVPDIAERDVYLCGPQPWTDAVGRTLTDAGLPSGRLHLEHFAW
jgi:predicted ferric reductase